jgi:GH15 family glucan-1,4-alpha-glucosidase
VEPAGVHRAYEPETNVLRTRFETATGVVEQWDLMTLADGERATHCPAPEHEILRRIACLAGEVEIECVFEPRPDWGRARLRWHDAGRLGICVTWGGEAVFLRGPARLAPGPGGARGTVRLRAGEEAEFSLVYAREGPAVVPPGGGRGRRVLEATIGFWRRWAAGVRMEGPWREAVVRSALALKLLVYTPSGAVLAAPTTSLPEQPGAPYNWDYRFCWLRDASFTVRALFGLGCFAEGAAFVDWLLYTTRLTRPKLQVLYDVFGGNPPKEHELAFAGWRGAGPVREGNAAAHQYQLDIYGEVVDAATRYVDEGGPLDREAVAMLAGFGRFVAQHWREPDAGIWETRAGLKAHTHSRVLCWAALEGLLRIDRVHPLGRGLAAALAKERDAIRRAVEDESYDAQLGSYVRSPGERALDAALLLLPAYGYTRARSPRMRGTHAAIRRTLGAGDLLYRHAERETQGEAAFLACAFWEADYLARGGGTEEEATAALRRLSARANDVGLFAEEIDPTTGEQLGNFPQGFSHVGLVNAALSLQARACRAARGLRGHHAASPGASPAPEARP